MHLQYVTRHAKESIRGKCEHCISGSDTVRARTSWSKIYTYRYSVKYSGSASWFQSYTVRISVKLRWSADLEIRCSHMSEGLVSHDESHMFCLPLDVVKKPAGRCMHPNAETKDGNVSAQPPLLIVSIETSSGVNSSRKVTFTLRSCIIQRKLTLAST